MSRASQREADVAALPLRTNGQRLWSSLEQLATIGGRADGGVQRLALTHEDREARRLVAGWAREIGCSERLDQVGNLFLRREGSDPQRPAVMVGSHLDSQPTGGRFDGALGVLAGLEVLRTLHERGLEHTAPVELAIWTDEEGARFDASEIGSSVFCGEMSLEDAYALTDRDGVTVRQAIEAVGLLGTHPVGQPLPDAYFELHIEQGPILEREDVPIGVVEGATGIEWYEVAFTGAAAHAGPTPMSERRDAGLAAGRLVEAVQRIGLEHQPDGRAAVCTLHAEPNAGSVLIGRSRLLVDLRHPDAAELAHMAHQLRTEAERIAALGAVAAAIRLQWGQPPASFDPDCRDLVRTAAEKLGLATYAIVSGAGHDAVGLSRVAPTAMIFIPCRDGISHHPDEWARPAHVTAGADVLLNAVLARAGRTPTVAP